MSQKLKGFTIHEGYTDLGTLSVNINHVESPVVPQPQNAQADNVSQASRFTLFRLLDTEGNPLPDGMRVEFKMDTADNEEVFTSYTSKEGFVGFNAPALPVVSRPAEGRFLLQFNLGPAYENRQEECYLPVLDEDSNIRYTLSGDLGVSEDYLGIYTDDETFYKLSPESVISEDITAIGVAPNGNLFVFNNDTGVWSLFDTLTFTQIEHPENLLSVAEGIYQTTGTTGILTTGTVGGDGPFAKFSLSVTNPGITKFDINLKVYEEENPTPIYAEKQESLTPGNRNYIPVTVDYTPAIPADNSPTLGDIETVSGTTFSEDLTDFLEDKELATLDALRKAGPLKYLIDLPETVSDVELSLLQAHTDFYSINPNATQNQRIIAAGYENLYRVSLTPKNIFINDVMDEEDLVVYKAAEIHETAVQQAKMLSNLISGIQADAQLDSNLNFTPLPNSDYDQTFFANFASSCSCDDCKSGVSPFAYLVDLLKYAAAHIKHAPSGYLPSSDYTTFVTLLEDKFYQSFGHFPVTCDLLHDEFCRVRLVTEVLEAYVLDKGLAPADEAILLSDRKKYLQLTYQTLLIQAGTSFDEVRDVFITQDLDVKSEKAERFASKLGIPVKVGGEYTSDKLWLYFTNPSTPADPHDLNAVNLETLFGFRNTQRDVLEDTPVSLMETWRMDNLRQIWKNADYPLTAYTREVSPNPDLEKKPIVDPDIMGLNDMTYFPVEELKKFWEYRKEDTDNFLDFFTTNPDMLDQANVARHNRLRVRTANIIGHVMEMDSVSLQANSVAPWIPLVIVNRIQSGNDVDLILEDVIPQITTDNAAMRYHRKVVARYLLPITGEYELTLDEDVVFALGGGEKKLVYVDDNNVETIFDDLEDVVIVGNIVTFNFASTPPTFIGGSFYFVYEAEVSLVDEVPSPQLLVDSLFNDDQTYTYFGNPDLTPPLTTVTYNVWAIPSGSSAGTYSDLKTIYSQLTAGIDLEANKAYIDERLHLAISEFTRMMQLFLVCETYLQNPFVSQRPTTEEIYELASIFRTSAKYSLYPEWVMEENTEYYEYNTSLDSYDQKVLHLNRNRFWEALSEPLPGSWDRSLESSVPLIDPELVRLTDLLGGNAEKPYRDSLLTRQEELEDIREQYLSYFSSSPSLAFSNIFNHIANDDIATPYDIAPYQNLEILVQALNSSSYYVSRMATDKLQDTFAMGKDEFLLVYDTMGRYSASLSASAPFSVTELKKTVDLFVTAYKKKQKYPDWKAEEIPMEAKYFLVFKMRMATGRSSYVNRSEWQRTLRSWSGQPVIDPDMVRPENIVDFLSTATNIIRDIWIERNNTVLPNLYNQVIDSFDNSYSPTYQLLHYKRKLVKYVFGIASNIATPENYITYFTDLQVKEETGEDIRPRVAQLNLSMGEYRMLRKVYDIIESSLALATTPLGDEEYRQVYDILVQVAKRNSLFPEFVQEEFEEDILLNGEDFVEYKPAINAFPLTDLPEYNAIRAPFDVRKDWFDVLETRNERKSTVEEAWKKMLIDTEERTLRVLRDALIRALAGGCESLDDAAERLARTLFIETKDNCCTRHTRISFALETLQKLVFALKNGIYDEYLNGFSLIAPNFDKEWEWIGSYATWRASVFAWFYPENLLYPTLKRLQSPGFRTLSQGLQDSSRLTPEQACQLGKQYQDHLEDILNLDVKFTVTSRANTYIKDADGCCGEETHDVDTDFYFAKSKISGRCYWASKQHGHVEAGDLGFWELIPDMEKCELLGCFPLPIDRFDNASKNGLWLFYSYRDGGDLKIGYRKRNLDTVRTGWGDLTDADDIPTEMAYGTATKKLGILYSVIASQSSVGWGYPTFIFSYRGGQQLAANTNEVVGGSYHLTFRYFDHEDRWDTDLFLGTYCYIQDPNIKPSAALGHGVGPNSPYAVSMAFNNYIKVCGYGTTEHISTSQFESWVGLFSAIDDENTVVWVYKKTNGQIVSYKKTFTGIASPGFDSTTTLVPNLLLGVTKIAPRFSVYIAPTVFAYRNTDNVWVSMEMNLNSNLFMTRKLGLMPNKISGVNLPVLVQSADCITDMETRKTNIQTHIGQNLDQSGPNYGLNYRRSLIAQEYLKEAYYFVPMLLALDQQQRGQYDASLDWYRSVYDYTRFPSQRKIYYGLKLEEANTNVFTRPSDWLMDPLNPHLIAGSRYNAYTRYTLMNIAQCLLAYADQEFTIDMVESVPRARILYSTALDLLETNGLKRKPNECRQEANCLFTSIQPHDDSRWAGLTVQLSGRYAAINDRTLLADVKEELETIFADTELDYAARFAAAAEVIEDAMVPKTTSDVLGVLDAGTARIAESMQFISAFAHTGTAMADVGQFVAERYSTAISFVSGVDVADLQTPAAAARLSWLATEPSAVNVDYAFSFASGDGVQHFTDERAYNPLAPTQRALDANLILSNANVFMGRDPQVPIPPAYYPIFDYVFCVPTNPVYDSLELKTNLELYKIHNCRNIAGMVRELDVYAAATDSVTGIPIIGAGGNLILPGLNTFRPTQYRFRTLVERAKQLAAQAQQLESLFLSAMEKRDAEYYNQLKARQDLQTAKGTIKLQDLRVKQAGSEQQMAQLQKEKAQFMVNTYNQWIDNGYNGYEIASLTLMAVSASLQHSSAAVSVTPLGGFNLAQGLGSTASAFSTMASMMSQIASYQRRSQEWQFQSDLANKDVGIANQQIKIAEDNIRIVSQEREIAQLNADHAQDTLEFLRNKFTNAELYNWMSNVLERTYSYMLNLATSVAKTAEGQLYFERQEPAGPFVMDDYWETPGDSYAVSGTGSNAPDRRGLTGSARLLMDITRLDQYAFDTDKRKLQLTKTISLGQNFPVEFQRFRETGVLNFELTNRIADYDFPGHYLRLIRSVKTTVVGLVPVYGGIKATLTAEPVSYTVVGDTIFQNTPIRRMEVDSVALTSPNNANGLFEMQQMQSEILNPFEGMGFESRWEYKMPRFSNRMDYDQIADVLITVEYTALDSFQYRYLVLQELGQNTTENTGGDISFNRAFSFRNNFPDQWFELVNAPEVNGLGQLFGVTFRTRREDFPAGFNQISLQDLTLCFAREQGEEELEVDIANFNIIPSNGAVSNELLEGETVNGIWGSAHSNAGNLLVLTTLLEDTEPFVTWKLEFDNTPSNRQLFSEGKIKDILFVLTCKGELPAYPL